MLILRFQKPLFKFLNGFHLPSGRTEEIAQETLLRAYQNLASYQQEKGASFVTWLFVIAKRLAINELARSEYRHPLVAIESAMDLESPVLSPPALLEAEQTRQLVLDAVQRVAEPFRTTLLLSQIEELKLTEIAEIEQCSVGTVKSRIFRGKQMLADLLSKTFEAQP